MTDEERRQFGLEPRDEEFVPDERRARYVSYRRGWTLGASGQTRLAAIGTPEPEYPQEFDLGFEEGRAAFVQAMNAAGRRMGFNC